MNKPSSLSNPTDIISKVQNTIANHQLLSFERPILVGFSGGADSVALLHILTQLGFSCIAAHCNFNLRGEESLRDHQFAKQFANQHNIPFYDIQFDTQQYAKAEHLSIEMACRSLRYDWFEQLCKDTNAQGVAIAHHQDDTIETFFLNLLRGTGITGLTGIKYRNGNIIRPLLDINRTQIEHYLKELQIDYITDSSNTQTIYQRNKIRLEVLPLLESITPSAKQAILKSIHHLQQTDQIYKEALAIKQQDLVVRTGEETHINISSLLIESQPKTILFELLKPYGIKGHQVGPILKACEGISGKRFYTPSHQIIKDRTTLIITPIKQEEMHEVLIASDCSAIQSPISFEIEHLSISPEFSIPRDPAIACLDIDKIQFPLRLRKWQVGDRFKPLGMKNFKKVSDYFSNRKMSLAEKENTWILESSGQICWLINQRLDDRFKVTTETKNVLLIRFVSK